jgi:hypothetical protein
MWMMLLINVADVFFVHKVFESHGVNDASASVAAWQLRFAVGFCYCNLNVFTSIRFVSTHLETVQNMP